MVAKGEVFDTSVSLAGLVDVEVGHCLQVLDGRKALWIQEILVIQSLNI